MTSFIKKHAMLSISFAAAGLLTLFFLVRFLVSTVVWSDPGLQDQEIAGWMTPRYIARSWQVEPEVVASGLGIVMDGIGRRATLDEIAVAQGRSIAELIADLEAALTTAKGTGND